MPGKIKHIIRGKTVKEWAEHFNVPVVTIYARMRRGILESMIDGTFVRKFGGNAPRVYEGKTAREWASELDIGQDAVRRHIKNGHLKDGVLSIPYGKKCRLVRGKPMSSWAKEFQPNFQVHCLR